MRRIMRGIVTSGVIALIALSLGVRYAQAADPEIVLRFAGNLPVTHHCTVAQELFAKLVHEKTAGKVKIEVYPSGQLFSDKDLLRALPSGAVDMGMVTCDQWSGIAPAWIFLDMPFFFKDRGHSHRVLESKVSEILGEELRQKSGVRLIFWMDYGAGGIVSKTPLRRLEDFKGKRIRAVGEVNAEMVKALGASPVTLGGAEVYMALQRGTVDGGCSGIASFWQRKYYEVTKYLSAPYYTYATFATLINEKKWNSIPADIQKKMMEAAEETKKWTFNECEKVDKEALVSLKEKGMEIYDPPEEEKARWKEACRPLLDLTSKRGGATGQLVMEIAEKLR